MNSSFKIKIGIYLWSKHAYISSFWEFSLLNLGEELELAILANTSCVYATKGCTEPKYETLLRGIGF